MLPITSQRGSALLRAVDESGGVIQGEETQQRAHITGTTRFFFQQTQELVHFRLDRGSNRSSDNVSLRVRPRKELFPGAMIFHGRHGEHCRPAIRFKELIKSRPLRTTASSINRLHCTEGVERYVRGSDAHHRSIFSVQAVDVAGGMTF